MIRSRSTSAAGEVENSVEDRVGACVASVTSHDGGEARDELVELRRILEVGDVEPRRDRRGLLLDVGVGHRVGEAEDRLDHLQQRRVGEQAVGGVDRRRLALEIERQAHALVVGAGRRLQRLADVAVDDALRRASKRRRGRAPFAEIEGRARSRRSARRRAVGEAVRVGDALGQHLAHERLGVGHVVQAERLHRVSEQPVFLMKSSMVFILPIFSR